VVAQQFEIGRQIASQGLVPILEPEVNITIADKARAETILKAALIEQLDNLPFNQSVMLKLTLPELPNHYFELCKHPRVLSVVALSGGYSRAEANKRLAQNTSVIASFSRALTEGLSTQQNDDEFDQTLSKTINEIKQASISG
jgi:fructose-bisphosphate aldolase class I